jgi:hypothetical protein
VGGLRMGYIIDIQADVACGALIFPFMLGSFTPPSNSDVSYFVVATPIASTGGG